MFQSMKSAIEYVFQTRRRLDRAPRGLDEHSRDPCSTRRLLELADLTSTSRQYVVVTGSRGKGSVASIVAKLLQALDRRAGLITSPHLVHWNERIRVNGVMIPNDDFLRILSDLRPHVNAITTALEDHQYLSPQGIFLAIALQFFDENSVDIGVLEVGRGGRYDDISVMPNRLALFAPIMLEHTALLGDSLERIAWHKAGIISTEGAALSTVQTPEVAAVLRREAAEQNATLDFISASDQARWLADYDGGQLIHLKPYGVLHLPLLGRYQIENATLAIRAVEILQNLRDTSDAEGAPPQAFIKSLRSGLAQVKWLGRVQKLAEAPTTYVDGAITLRSARSFLESVEDRLSQPVVSIVGVPRDRDYAGVYRIMAGVSDILIITETDINPSTRFPARDEALGAARECGANAVHTSNLTDALSLARDRTGEAGTILLAVSLMLVGECMLIWQIDTTQI